MMSSRLKYSLTIALVIFGMLGQAYFGITALLEPVKLLAKLKEVDASGVIFAQYMAVRNLSLIVLGIIILARKERRVLGYFLLLNGVIQVGDSILGATRHDVMSAVFPVILAVLYFLSARFLLWPEVSLKE